MNWEDDTNRPNYLSEVSLFNLRPQTIRWYENGLKTTIRNRYRKVRVWVIRYVGYIRFQLENLIKYILRNNRA